MRFNKSSSTITAMRGDLDDYILDVDADLTTIGQVLSGRIRFGDAGSGSNGDNIAGQFVQFTTSGTPDAENIIPHTMGIVPVGYLVLWQSASGSLYQGPTGGTTDWDEDNVYLKCSVASVTFKLFLLK